MESIQKLREPFKKRILLTKTAITLAYDAVFQMKDTADWTLALTYMTYAPKPLLIVCEDIVIPDGFWAKVQRNMTVVHFTSQPTLQIRPYDAIFFSEEPNVDHMFKMLQSIYRASYSTKEHKEILQELRIAGAGLVWSKVEEDQGGQVYWYDPVPSMGNDKLSNAQLVDVFSLLARQFSG